MFKLGELKEVQEMRSALISSGKIKQQEKPVEEHWNDFVDASDKIKVACEDQDLSSLASNVRKMKNLLRRPSVKKELARLESDETSDAKVKELKGGKGKDEKPQGQCNCAQCGKTIEGSREPCEEGALCVDCGMKKRQRPPGEKDNKEAKKKAKKPTPFPPEMVGMAAGQPGDGGGDSSGKGNFPKQETTESCGKYSGKKKKNNRLKKIDENGLRRRDYRKVRLSRLDYDE